MKEYAEKHNTRRKKINIAHIYTSNILNVDRFDSRFLKKLSFNFDWTFKRKKIAFNCCAHVVSSDRERKEKKCNHLLPRATHGINKQVIPKPSLIYHCRTFFGSGLIIIWLHYELQRKKRNTNIYIHRMWKSAWINENQFTDQRTNLF